MSLKSIQFQTRFLLHVAVLKYSTIYSFAEINLLTQQLCRKEKMIKLPLNVGLLVIPCLLVFSFVQVAGSASETRDSFGRVLLSNSDVMARWPDLPTAEDLYTNGPCLVIDLRYCGKQVSSINESLPDPNFPTVVDIESILVNCTQNIPNYLKGGINYDSPQIWLQYNDTIWLQVPYTLLK